MDLLKAKAQPQENSELFGKGRAFPRCAAASRKAMLNGYWEARVRAAESKKLRMLVIKLLLGLQMSQSTPSSLRAK